MSLSRDAAGEAFYMHGGVNHIDTRGALWYNWFHRGNRNLSSGGKRMICLVCGRDNPNYAVVCEQCGNFLPREEPGKKVRGLLDPIAKGKIRCSYCWSDNEATDTACRMCGMPLGFVPYSDSGAGAPGLSDKPIEGMPTEDEFFGEAGEDDLYGNLGLNDPEFWEQANKELTEEPETFETPVVNIVPENVTPVANPVPEGMVRCRSCTANSAARSFRLRGSPAESTMPITTSSRRSGSPSSTVFIADRNRSGHRSPARPADTIPVWEDRPGTNTAHRRRMLRCCGCPTSAGQNFWISRKSGLPRRKSSARSRIQSFAVVKSCRRELANAVPVGSLTGPEQRFASAAVPLSDPSPSRPGTMCCVVRPRLSCSRRNAPAATRMSLR